MSNNNEVADAIQEQVVRHWFIHHFKHCVDSFDYDVLVELSRVIDIAIMQNKKELH